MRSLTIMKPQGGGLFFSNSQLVGDWNPPRLESVVRAFLITNAAATLQKNLLQALSWRKLGFSTFQALPDLQSQHCEHKIAHRTLANFHLGNGFGWARAPPPTLFVCNGGAPPAAARSHRGGQTRSWPDSCRYASENLWVRRRRLLWAARLSTKYLMNLLISEKALLGGRRSSHVTSSTRREHETKGRGVGGEAPRTVRSVLGAGINSSLLVRFLSDKSKNNKKKKHSERVSSGCRFQFQPHFIPSLRQSGTLVVYEQLCRRPQLRWDVRGREWQEHFLK